MLLSPRCNDEIASVGKCIDLLCVAAYRGTKIRLTETFDTSFPFWGLIDRHTNTVYFHILCVVSEPLCLEMDKNVQGLFTIPVSALFFCNEQFGNCVFHYFVCCRRKSLWASQKLPGRETELCQWGEAPKGYCKFLQTKYRCVFDAVYATFYSPRLISQILNMQKRRTLAPNLRCLKVSALFCFKTGTQADIL